MVDTGARFQPAPEPTYVVWNKEHCDSALQRARELKIFLAKLAVGEFPREAPVRMIGVKAYLELPPKPGGEPRIELAGYTAEFALNLPRPSEGSRRPSRLSNNTEAESVVPAESQLGLFDAPSVATAPAGKKPEVRQKPF